ncbi:MAG: hypothetical protein M3M99_03455 [Actinomycetota bacterium]|nr:hypothetical protein [Actinomycetota bacterium]
MGWTADSFTGKVDGHPVEVQARSGPISARFALLVDGEVQDMTKAMHGDHWLEGEAPGGKPFRVRVNLKAGGLGGESYFIEVDGEEKPLGEGFIV